MSSGDKKFKLKSSYLPTGDQPSAIKSLTEGVFDGLKTQVLLGVTGVPDATISIAG